NIVAAKEDVQETIKQLNGLKSGHKPVAWDGALRQPFDHLNVYNEWLQRVDPLGTYNKEGLLQLHSIVFNVKSAIEAHQNPRGLLKRISTVARGVLRRQSLASSAQPLSDESQGQLSSPTNSYMFPTSSSKGSVSTQARRASMGLPIPRLVTSPSTIALFTSENRIETVTKEQVVSLVTEMEKSNGSVGMSSDSAVTDSATGPSRPLSFDTKVPGRHLNRVSVARSDSSSIGSLTLAPSSESLFVKAAMAATAAKSSSSTITGSNRINRQLSVTSQRQKLPERHDSRRTTIHMDTQTTIVSKAESMQPKRPEVVSRPSIDRLRTITKREAEEKPPVRSLISFWEQATEPIEAM
ncbi:hypothetical protein BGZ54_006548, partial [Gamsiella multidivaricata]